MSDTASKQEQKELLQNEGSILQALLAMDSEGDAAKAEKYPIEIRRNGRVMLEFHVRPISEAENQQCFHKASKYTKARGYGQPRQLIDTDQARYRSWIIYTATTAEDRKAIWDNPAAMKQMHIFEGVDMIDRILHQGEKVKVIDKIDEISGFNDSPDDDTPSVEETVKN
jgi:hypothetical protein